MLTVLSAPVLLQSLHLSKILENEPFKVPPGSPFPDCIHQPSSSFIDPRKYVSSYIRFSKQNMFFIPSLSFLPRTVPVFLHICFPVPHCFTTTIAAPLNLSVSKLPVSTLVYLYSCSYPPYFVYFFQPQSVSM